MMENPTLKRRSLFLFHAKEDEKSVIAFWRVKGDRFFGSRKDAKAQTQRRRRKGAKEEEKRVIAYW